MADFYPPSHHTYYNKQNMRRTAPSGTSRETFPAEVSKVERFPSAPQQSRLQKLQANFQYKVMKEKEAKMIDMYERQQYQALQKISSKQPAEKGMVRDFFRERRLIEQGTVQSNIPTRDDHFNRMKSKVQQQREAHMRQDLSKMHAREDLSRKPPAGLDRAKPLAPLKHRSTVHNMNISQHRFTENTDEHIPNRNTTKEVFTKKKLKKTNSVTKLPKRYSQETTEESSDEDPPYTREPRSHNKWEQNPYEKTAGFVGNRKKIISEIKEDRYQKKVAAPRKREEKLSDFQKWQMDQDLEREQRLSKLRKQKQHDDENMFDFNQFEETNWTRNDVKKRSKKEKNTKVEHDRQKQIDIIKQKEKELQEIIAKQEAELKKIKESYMSDEYASPRQFNDSHSIKPQTKTTKKPSEKSESVPYYTPPKTKKPDKVRRPLIKETTANYHRKQPHGYHDEEEEDEESMEPNIKVSYDIVGALQESDQVSSLKLQACNACGRKFAEDRLAKHSVICRKTSTKKRKTFDMAKQRTAGTECEQYVKNGHHLKSEPTPKKSNWKRKHEDFVRTVRDARLVQAHIAKGGKASDLPPPPPSDNSDYKECPYCKRKFNPSTAERHIPKCKDIKSRPKPPSKRR
ncbi:uncharacterized protein [Antedon mediterranea]|uniref:uncharacterized protein n=1 Tax=Antedon mediterranea TaxID=105859 RepID=UPI003AF99580